MTTARRVAAAVAVTAAACLLAMPLRAQGRRGVPPKPPPSVEIDRTHLDPSRIVVKFVEGAAVRLREGRFVGPLDLRGANALLAESAGVTRLFERSEAELDAERGALLQRWHTDQQPQPGGGGVAAIDPPADLNNYYLVRAADEDRGEALLRAFNAQAGVEIAFADHRPTVPCEPGDILPATPNLDATQSYRDPAPTGIDQRRARTIPGGRGEDVQLVDVESSWQLAHEDARELVAANVIGQHQMSLNPDHGVAVIGELAADWDRSGTSGLVDRVRLKVHSHMRTNWASSVNVAAANVPAGGFVILEVQLTFGNTSLLVPMEVRQDVFDATRNAVLAGKHVIAAAANGGNDLDSPTFQRLFDRTFRDSGAVLVGATEGAALTRASFSNHGSRIDANGYGRNVTTLGYGDLFAVPGDPRQSYTASFSGTSSATPIVAGAAIALAGAAERQLGRRLTPAELRTLLQQHGTDVPGGRIGKRPDLKLLLAAIGLPKGLELQQDAGLGQTMRLELNGAAGAAFALAVAPTAGLVDLGAAGRFLLDPATATAIAVGMLPATGRAAFTFRVPNDGSLRGASLHLQGALVPPSMALALTNSVANYVP